MVFRQRSEVNTHVVGEKGMVEEKGTTNKLVKKAMSFAQLR